MELQRKEYPALLTSLTPAQAVNVLNDRVGHIGQLNTQIADWLQERRRIEETYAHGLQKLAAKHLPDESSDLGIFSTPWHKITSATQSVAQSHQILANKIEADVERPLREFTANNREIQAMGSMSGNLAAIAKDVDLAQKKSSKLRDKGSKVKASAVTDAAQDSEKAELQWDSQAPYVFEQLQAADETRLNHLRDALTQFQTHEVDQVERNRVTAEETLNVLLNVETADEIQTWALKMRSGDLPAPSRKLNTATTPSRTLAPPPAPTVHGAADDDRSQKSGSVQEKHSSNPLKRIGTVLGRRRQSHHPYGRTASPERRSSSNLASAFGGFGKGKSKDRDAVSPSAGRSSSPAKRLSAPSRSPAQPEFSSHLRPVNADSLNGTSSDIPAEESASTGMNEDSLMQNSLPEVQEPLSQSGMGEMNSEPEKDAEGFSVPPSTIDAITEAEREASSYGDIQNEGNPQPQFKLDIRNAPIQEEDADANAATANLVNTLRAQAAAPKRSSTLRGRRDVRNTIFVPNPITPELQSLQSIGEVPIASQEASSAPVSASGSMILPPVVPNQPASPSFKAPHRSLLHEDHAASDTQSIRSGRSLSSSASTTVKHPDLRGPGLNASLVEIVSAWFEQGTVTKAMVIGQVALVNNAMDISADSFGSENIRLENFPTLEKVAPNPAFIEQVADNPGNYTVDLSKITKTLVAFHYQLHVAEENIASLAPIVLSPAWKAEPLQISAILHYSLNPKFNLGGAHSVTISNLILVLRLEPGSKATSAQSKPPGTFSRDKALIYWRLGEVTISQDQPAQAMRVRFLTDGEAKAGNAEARWEISGERTLNFGSRLGVSSRMASSEAKQDGEADPFADTDEASAPTSSAVMWKPVTTVKKISSGTYLGV